MLEARAELLLRPSFDLPRKDSTTVDDSSGDPASSSLAQQLMDIFQFEKPEDVIDGRICVSSARLHADDKRVPMLASEKRLTSGLFVYHV